MWGLVAAAPESPRRLLVLESHRKHWKRSRQRTNRQSNQNQSPTIHVSADTCEQARKTSRKKENLLRTTSISVHYHVLKVKCFKNRKPLNVLIEFSFKGASDRFERRVPVLFSIASMEWPLSASH